MEQKSCQLDSKQQIEKFNSNYAHTNFFVNDEGHLCYRKDEKIKELANFFIVPLENVYTIREDDKLKKPHKIILEGILEGTDQLAKIEVPYSELHKPKWVKELSPFCAINKKADDNFQYILKFLQIAQKTAPSWIEVDTIGWHHFNKQWIYAHSGGVIGETAENIRLTTNRHFLNTDNRIQPKEAFLRSLNMLGICDHKLTFSLLSLLLTSIITTPLLQTKQLSPNYLLWVMGGTGLGKTTFTSFFTNIFTSTNVARVDAHKTRELVPNIAERKDSVFIVDDFGTSKTNQKQYSVINKVEDLIRELGDRATLSYEKNISKGMLLITGERFLDQTDKNESSIKRTIRVKMDNLFNQEKQATYDPRKVENFNLYKNTKYLPTSISYYLEWLSVQLNGDFITRYKQDFESLRTSLDKSASGRYIDAFAHQIIAFNFYMSYGEEKKFITPEQCTGLRQFAKKVFLELFDDQYDTIIDPNVELFLDTLQELIFNDVIKIEVGGEQLDFLQNIYGVVLLEKGIEVLKLDWEITYNLVKQHIHESNTKRTSFVGNKELAKLMDRANLIAFNDHGTTTQFLAITKNLLPPFYYDKKRMTRCRVINIRIDCIPQIMKIIMNKQNEEYTVHNNRMTVQDYQRIDDSLNFSLDDFELFSQSIK